MNATKSDTTTPAATKAPRLTNCHCLTGTEKTCDRTTYKAFAQGHDARMSSRIAQAIASGEMSEADGIKLIRQAGGGDLLVSKTTHSAKLRAGKAEGAKAAKDTEDKPKAINYVGREVEIFHGKRSFKGAVVRNASQELVARHRLNSKNCDHAVDFDGEEVFAGQAL